MDSEVWVGLNSPTHVNDLEKAPSALSLGTILSLAFGGLHPLVGVANPRAWLLAPVFSRSWIDAIGVVVS